MIGYKGKLTHLFSLVPILNNVDHTEAKGEIAALTG